MNRPPNRLRFTTWTQMLQCLRQPTRLAYSANVGRPYLSQHRCTSAFLRRQIMTKSQDTDPSLADDFSLISQATSGILEVWVKSLDEAHLRHLGALMGNGVTPGLLILPHGPHEACEGRVVLVDSQGASQVAATLDFSLHRVMN